MNKNFIRVNNNNRLAFCVTFYQHDTIEWCLLIVLRDLLQFICFIFVTKERMRCFWRQSELRDIVVTSNRVHVRESNTLFEYFNEERKTKKHWILINYSCDFEFYILIRWSLRRKVVRSWLLLKKLKNFIED